MNTEKNEDFEDIKVTEAADGSATVDLPGDFGADDDDDQDDEKAEGGQAEASDDGDQADQADDEPNQSNDSLIEARRSKRRAKRELAKRSKEEKDQYLLSLQRQNQALQERLAAVEKKQSTADIARMNKAIEDEQLKLEYAKAKMEEATSNSDGATFAKAQELWYETRQKIDSMKAVAKQATKSVVKQEAAINPKLQSYVNRWTAENPWYDPMLRDLDSKIARAVDESLGAEGWDPSNEDYWEELDRRLSTRLPHRYTDDTYEKVPRSTRRRSVVTGSGRENVPSAGQGKGMILDPEQVRAMKEAGFWDDPKKRSRMIQRYAEQARQQRNRS